MSETLSPIEFNTTHSPVEVMDAVANEGAVAVHGFMNPHALARAAAVLQYAQFETDNNPNNEKVDRHHDLIKYGFVADAPWPVHVADGHIAPAPVFWAAQNVTRFIQSAPQTHWQPNEIMGHRYEPGHFINAHRDLRSARGYVSVLTLEGEQEFHFVRDNGEEAQVTMEPGTLTIMRGYQPETHKPRPEHWVEPAVERRLALSLRHVAPLW